MMHGMMAVIAAAVAGVGFFATVCAAIAIVAVVVVSIIHGVGALLQALL